MRSLRIDEHLVTEIKGLEQLTNLEELNLSMNQIRVIKGLESLTKLKKLYLFLNPIDEVKGLDQLTNLRVLSLGHCRIMEIKGLDKLTNLEELNLFNNQISELKKLENLTNLRKVDLRKNQLKEQEYEIAEKGAEAVVKYCQEKKTGTLASIDYILKEMEQELGFSLQHIGKLLGRFFPRTLWNYYSAEKHNYPAVKNAEELLKFIDEYYTTALLWPCYKGPDQSEYLSETYVRVESTYDGYQDDYYNTFNHSKEIESQLLEPWYEYAELNAFDKKMLNIIEGMSFRKEFVYNWVNESTRLYQHINGSPGYIELDEDWHFELRGIKSRLEFLHNYILGDRIKFYGKLRRCLATELNVHIKDFSAMEKAYNGFWKRWIDTSIRFYHEHYINLIGWLGRTVQVDSSFWIESDYYALLVKEFISITKELLKHLDLDYSHTAKMKLVRYFRNYFGEWEYSSFSRFMMWCEKVNSGTISLTLPGLPSGNEKERAEREKKHKNDLEYHKKGFADYLKHFGLLYEKLITW